MAALGLPAPPWFIGHRGVRGAVPENTVDSVREAVALRADMVELDLQLTGDGELITFHDLEVRISDEESRAVAQCSLAEIKAYRRIWRRRGVERAWQIPTLDEILVAAPPELPLNLEIKRHDRTVDPAAMVDALVAVLARRDRVLVSSFDWGFLAAVGDRIPGARLAPLGGLTSEWDELVELARGLDAFSIHLHRRLAADLGGKGRLDEPAAKERPILAYTVNRGAEARQLLRFGVSGFFTDRPGELREQLAGDI